MIDWLNWTEKYIFVNHLSRPFIWESLRNFIFSRPNDDSWKLERTALNYFSYIHTLFRCGEWISKSAQLLEEHCIVGIYINTNLYIFITNCRQYFFGLLSLISAMLMLGWRRTYMVTPNDPTLVVSSKPCQSAQTRKS